MKKLLPILLVTIAYVFSACSNTATTAEETTSNEEIDTLVDEITEAEEEEVLLADHTCNAECTEEVCSLKCGEKGHGCSTSCHSRLEKEAHEHTEGEAHTHAEGEEHDH